MATVDQEAREAAVQVARAVTREARRLARRAEDPVAPVVPVVTVPELRRPSTGSGGFSRGCAGGSDLLALRRCFDQPAGERRG